MKLVADWRKALKWYTVQAQALNVTFLLVWAGLPEKFQNALPVPWVIGIAVTLLMLGVTGRLVQQEPQG